MLQATAAPKQQDGRGGRLAWGTWQPWHARPCSQRPASLPYMAECPPRLSPCDGRAHKEERASAPRRSRQQRPDRCHRRSQGHHPLGGHCIASTMLQHCTRAGCGPWARLPEALACTRAGVLRLARSEPLPRRAGPVHDELAWRLPMQAAGLPKAEACAASKAVSLLALHACRLAIQPQGSNRSPVR